MLCFENNNGLSKYFKKESKSSMNAVRQLFVKCLSGLVSNQTTPAGQVMCGLIVQVQKNS